MSGHELLLANGAERLAALHAAELPQKDELCGAFCVLMALGAAGLADPATDQDAVAASAGTRVTTGGAIEPLPPGEPGRRDYRTALREVADASRSGTTVAGMIRAVEQLGAGRLAALPLHGAWSVSRVLALIDATARAARPATLIANIATEHLWGTRSAPADWLRHLQDGDAGGPPPDWSVGHFVCLLGAIRGRAGTLVIVADTYPSLGWQGIHFQPVARIVAALERPGRAAGGVLAVVDPRDVPAVRAAAAGLVEGAWDNGTAG
jgi:hypothetical protein